MIFSTGVVPAISSLVRKLTTPAEKVLVETPIYNIFFNSILNNGRVPLECPLTLTDHAELTADQLQDVFDAAMTATTTYGYNSLEPYVDYPAIAGVKAHLSIDGTSNTLMDLNGASLDQNKTYSVVVSQIIINALKNLRNANVNSFQQIDDTLLSCFTAKLKTGSLPSVLQYYEVEAAE